MVDAASQAHPLVAPSPLQLLSCAVAVLFWGGMPLVRAETTATVLETEAAAPVVASERLFFDSELGAALREQQIAVTAQSDRDLIFAEEKRLQRCRTAVCTERIGRLLGSRYVIRADVTVARDGQPPSDGEPKKDKSGRVIAPKTTPGDWLLNLELFHVDIGASGAQLRGECRRCDTAQAGKALSDLLQKSLFEEAARPRGSIQIVSKPPGALVFVDGTDLGVTPFKRPAYSGNHRLLLRSAGFRSEQREIEVPDSQRLQLDVTLAEGEDPAELGKSMENRTPIYKKWWFWVAVGGAAAAVAGAATAGALASQGPTPNGTPAANHFVF